MSCVEEGCNGRVIANQLCWPHYRRLRQSKMPKCSQDGCTKRANSNEVCPNHYYQLFLRPKARDRALTRKYGLTDVDIVRIVGEQGGCGVCGTQDPGASGWQVDHDHKCCPGPITCGECVRGILCRDCNTNVIPGIDSPHLLAALRWVFPDGMPFFEKNVVESVDTDEAFS